MAEQSLTTLECIHLEAKKEFSQKGYRSVLPYEIFLNL